MSCGTGPNVQVNALNADKIHLNALNCANVNKHVFSRIGGAMRGSTMWCPTQTEPGKYACGKQPPNLRSSLRSRNSPCNPFLRVILWHLSAMPSAWLICVHTDELRQFSSVLLVLGGLLITIPCAGWHYPWLGRLEPEPVSMFFRQATVGLR